MTACRVGPRVGARPDTAAQVDALNEFLFVEQGFRGNRDAYYDPRNSYLNDVLDRRLGIPITLAVVFLEVAWRLRGARHLAALFDQTSFAKLHLHRRQQRVSA